MGRRVPPTEAEEFRTAEAAARAARVSVGEQASVLLLERAMTGDRRVLAMRLSQLAAAERDGDVEAVRAAVMEIGLAALSWCVSIDLRQPGSAGGKTPGRALPSAAASNGRS